MLFWMQVNGEQSLDDINTFLSLLSFSQVDERASCTAYSESWSFVEAGLHLDTKMTGMLQIYQIWCKLVLYNLGQDKKIFCFWSARRVISDFARRLFFSLTAGHSAFDKLLLHILLLVK